MSFVALEHNIMAQESSDCNITAYSEWHSSNLKDTEHIPLSLYQLRTDLLNIDRQTKVWRIMDFDRTRDDFVKLYGGRRPKRLNITNGQAMEASSVWCKENIQSIKDSSAGGHGPPQPDGCLSADYHGNFLLTVHDAMCMNYCLSSDSLRAEAIILSQCNCLELSTKEDEISYTREGDFCLKNSGHLLCEKIGLDTCNKCDELKDFTCARREYDAIQVPLRGYGNECSGCAMPLNSALFVGIAFLSAALSFFR